MKADMIKVIPLDGAQVLHPKTFKPIPEEGKVVRRETYWVRMEAQGAIEIQDAETPEQAQSAEAPAAEPAPQESDIKPADAPAPKAVKKGANK